jgi:RNA-binding motif protein, X-linked 2
VCSFLNVCFFVVARNTCLIRIKFLIHPGDCICILSQFGEVDDIHLVREDDTGKSRGFGFVKYEDARSCVLAVDNLIGSQILGRSLRVDHVEHYRLPKKLQEQEQSKREQQEQLGEAGHAYKGVELENKYNIQKGVDLFAPTTLQKTSEGGSDVIDDKEAKYRRKEERRRKREEKEVRRRKREEKRELEEEKNRGRRARRLEEEENEKSSISALEQQFGRKHKSKKKRHPSDR